MNAETQRLRPWTDDADVKLPPDLLTVDGEVTHAWSRMTTDEPPVLVGMVIKWERDGDLRGRLFVAGSGTAPMYHHTYWTPWQESSTSYLGDALCRTDMDLVEHGYGLPGAAAETPEVIQAIATSWTYRRMVGHAQNQAALDASKGEG